MTLLFKLSNQIKNKAARFDHSNSKFWPLFGLKQRLLTPVEDTQRFPLPSTSCISGCETIEIT